MRRKEREKKKVVMKRKKKTNKISPIEGLGVKLALKKMKRKVIEKPKKIKMRRKPKPVVEEPPRKVKVHHPTIYTRKDGKQTCFVCYKPLHDLRDLLEMKGTNEEYSKQFDILKCRVNRDITCLGKRAGTLHPLYRCITCEPGSFRWLKNSHLKKLSEQWREE